MNQTELQTRFNVKADVTSAAWILLTTMDLILVLTIVVGNSLTIAAVCRFRTLQNPSNVMIVFLCVCDLIMAVLMTPLKVVFVTFPSFFLTRIPCMCSLFVCHFSAYAAILGLSAMSLDRAYAVEFPFHYHASMTVRRAAVASLLSLGLALVITLPMVTGLGQWDTQVCLVNLIYPKAYLRMIIFVAATLLLVGFAGFVRVLLAELRRWKQNSVLERSHDSLTTTSSRRSKLMCVVYVSSLVCWTPQLMYYFYNTLHPGHLEEITYRILSLCALSSSAINFFIYGFKNSNFRRSYKQLLGFRSHAIKPSDLVVSRQSRVADESTW